MNGASDHDNDNHIDGRGARSGGGAKPTAARVLGRPDAPVLPKKFYQAATVAPSGAGHTILLDGRPVKTPRKAVLEVPSEAVASAIAHEWNAQTDRIDPSTMPLTRLANSAVDVVAANADVLRAEVVAYAMSDLLCYRADGPADLVARQAAAWDPVLDWVARSHAVRLEVTTGVMHLEQHGVARAAIEAAVAGVDPWRLAAVHLVTTLTGSAVLALALEAAAVTTTEAWQAAHVDEDYQIEQWGEDDEASQRRANRWRDMAAAGALLSERP